MTLRRRPDPNASVGGGRVVDVVRAAERLERAEELSEFYRVSAPHLADIEDAHGDLAREALQCHADGDPMLWRDYLARLLVIEDRIG